MSVIESINTFKQLGTVRVVATSNQTATYFNGPTNNGVGATLTFATGTLTIDSVLVLLNDSVLLSAQTLGYQDGIYQCIVQGAVGVAAVLQRRGDLQCIEQLRLGHYTIAAAGTVDAGSLFSIVEPLPLAIGVPLVAGANNINFASTSAASGIGTAAAKAASDNSQPSLASVNGATTTNALAVFADTVGSVKDQTVAGTLGFGLTLATGNLAASQGNVTAGSSGHAGLFTSFPGTAANGSFIFKAVNNASNFASTLSNSAVGQASVYTLPDPAAATANVLVAPAALVSGNFVSASGTGGLVIDSGFPITAGRLFAQVSMTAAQFNGMYAAPVLLVAAPGANTMIVVESIQLQMTFVSANYAAGGVVSAQYDSTVNGAGVHASSDEAAADFFAAASTVFKLNGGLVLAPFTTCANKGLYLSNLTQAFTTGDSTWRIKVYYHLISTTA